MEKEFPYQLLEWDSNFLGFPVAAIKADEFHGFETSSIFQYLKSQKIKLVYLFSEDEISDSLKLASLDFLLADDKVTFQKKQIQLNAVSPYIDFYKDQSVSDGLLNLTYQSGLYSRFFIDKHFEDWVFPKMYKTWIEKSVLHEIAKQVIVYNENKEIKGFITVGDKNGIGDIGLVAVDEKSRGKGIGKQLLLAADNWFLTQDLYTVQVVTQGLNIPALKLYEAAGFEIFKRNFIYHVWL